MRNKLSTCLIVIGFLLIVLAILLLSYNAWDDYLAGRKSKKVLDDLTDKIVIPDEPSYLISSEVEMPTVNVDNNRYIGVLNLVPLGIKLPIISDYSYEKMRIAPVRYKGSVYLDNIIIAGHGYVSHFKNIKYLKVGDQITFTDMEGNIFKYEVIKQEIIDQDDVKKMEDGDWDMTLFTCNFDNSKRITIRLRNITKD